MGILDGFQFDPRSFAGGVPNWLEMALRSQGAGPSQGFPQNQQGSPDSFDARWNAMQPAMPPSAPPPMSTMAGAAGYGAGVDAPPLGRPEPAQLPQSAMPVAGQGMPMQAQPQPMGGQPAPAPAAPGPGLFDRLSAGAINFTTGGNPLAGLLNMVSGLSTGQRTDRMGQALQQQHATMQALTQAGIPPAVAQAAALNPEILKIIAPQLYNKPEFKTIKNALQEDIPVFVNADKQTITYPTATGGTQGANAPGGMQQTFDQLEAARNQGATPQQMLQTIPNSLRSGVEAMLSGGVIPSNLSNRGSARDLTLRFAHAIDPTFDETLIPARVALQKSYQGGGKNYQETLALNTVGGHLSRLADAADGLGNTGFKPWNWLKNQATDATIGNPALVKFRNDLVTTQNELAKAYHGGHVSDSAYNAFSNAIGEAQTPAELKTAIGELAGLLQSKIESNESGYRTGMNGLPLPAQYRAINEEAKHSFDRIGKWVSSGAAAAQPDHAGEPATLPAAGADGWIALPNGIKIREKK